MPLSDNEIIEKVRDGASHYYAHLVDRYKDRAMMLAMRILRRREDAEEATQDAFIRAYNALNGFQGSARFGTWFYRILYNVCLTRLGKRKGNLRSIDYDDAKEYDITSITLTADTFDYENKDMIVFIKNTIETLPSKYGTILSLFYFQELSHDEICEVTQLPLGTVKTHLFRARAMLHQQLQKEFQFEITI